MLDWRSPLSVSLFQHLQSLLDAKEKAEEHCKKKSVYSTPYTVCSACLHTHTVFGVLCTPSSSTPFWVCLTHLIGCVHTVSAHSYWCVLHTILVCIAHLCWCALHTYVGVRCTLLLVCVAHFCWCALHTYVGVRCTLMLVCVAHFCWCALHTSVGVRCTLLLVCVAHLTWCALHTFQWNVHINFFKT